VSALIELASFKFVVVRTPEMSLHFCPCAAAVLLQSEAG
jgi:hypothetical protein